jgi:TonB family protein
VRHILQKNVVGFLSKRVICGFVLIVACNLPFHAQSPAAPSSQNSSSAQAKTSDPKMSSKVPGSGGLEILSDTMGVDFTPYMKKLRYTVQAHWELLIPESARPPISKSGTVVIEFAIKKDGKVAGMKLVKSSDDFKLDAAAWGAITNAIPLPMLPAEFKGDFLQMRSSFIYNPAVTKPPLQAPTPVATK